MLRIGLFAMIALYFFGKKKKSTGEDMTPRGVSHTIVPLSYLQSVHGKHWASAEYKNQIVIDDSSVEGVLSAIKKRK